METRRKKFNTVLGEISGEEVGITLPHEHICCYSEYMYKMAGNKYLDKEKLVETSVKYLLELKERYDLKTFVDCTPVNIGRDVDLLKVVSEKSGVNIICSTGFYYTEELILYNTPMETVADYMIRDAVAVNAGVIKCAVEYAEISPFVKKLLCAVAKTQLTLGLPVVLHTNANNKNGLAALEILRAEGVKPEAITVGHLSDTRDLDYVKQIADYGCFIGLDRMYGHTTEEYVSEKVESIRELCKAGYENQILVAHDALFFNGFEGNPVIYEKPRMAYSFDHILSRLDPQTAENIMIHNPVRMLGCGE